MPRPGGESGKLGHRYEALRTMYVALDVFEEKLKSITVEAIGENWATSYPETS